MEIKDATYLDDLEEYKEKVLEKLNALYPIFAKASIGIFSDDVEITEEEDEFSELYVGVQVMLDVIREKISELENLNELLEKNIRERTKALEEAQSIAHIGSWEWDVFTDALSWSDELYRIFGLRPQSMRIGFDDYINRIHPQDRDIVNKYIQNSFTSKKPFTFYHRILQDKGKERILFCRGKVLADPSGQVMKMYGTAQDLTDLKHAEYALKEANTMLEERVAERTREIERAMATLKREIEEKEKAQLKNAELAAIVESSDDVIIGNNKNGIITSWNRGAGALFGISAKESIGKPVKSLFPREKRKELISVFNKVASGKTVRNMEITLEKENDHKKYFSFSFSPVKNTQGNIIGVAVIGRDITYRFEYEAQMNRQAKFTEENPNPVLRFSVSESKLVYANKAGQVLVSPFVSSIRKRIKKRWVTFFKLIYERKEVQKKEIMIGNKTFMCTMIPIHPEGYINFYATDITVIKEAEAEIKKLSLFISKTDNSVIMADRSGKIQYVNEGFERLTGYSLADIKGTSGEILRRGKKTGLHPLTPWYRKLVKEKQTVSYESCNYRKDGTEYWTLSTLTPIVGSNGEVESIVAVDSDITARKRAEQEIIAAKRIAEESSKAKELFLANMSHEIRTPLNAIMGIVQLMDDTKLTDEQKEYMKSVNFASENLLRIINDVLDLSKIESGKLGIEKLEFDIYKLLGDIIDSMSYRASEKNIDVIKSIDQDIPHVLVGDPVRINQVLVNLIGNAIKYTERGHITISVRQVKRENGNVLLRFDVEDTGIGIGPEFLPSLFEPFEQAHKEASRKYMGIHGNRSWVIYC
jgi:PAS domain S-box-containing protein